MTQQGWAPLPAPQAPAPPPYFLPPPPPKPSGGYKALGIVQATLGAAGFLYSLVSLVAVGAVFATMSKAALYTPAELAVTCGRTGMNSLTGVMLIVTGIGVFKAKRWSRIVGVVYAAASLTETILGGLLNFMIVMPASSARTHGLMGGDELEAMVIGMAVLGALVASALPIVTLVALLSARAKAELDQ